MKKTSWKKTIFSRIFAKKHQNRKTNLISLRKLIKTTFNKKKVRKNKPFFVFSRMVWGNKGQNA
jgi:hypothetical protein